MSKKEVSVLCIEDDNTTRESLVRTLSYNYEHIYSSSDGNEAIEQLKNNKIDVIITDIKMPKMDGMALLEYLKDNKIDIPVIILTAYDSPDYLHKAIDFKVEKFLNKPIDLESLIDSIDSIKPKESINNSDVKEILHDLSFTTLEMKLQKDFGYIDMNKFYESIDSIDDNVKKLNNHIRKI